MERKDELRSEKEYTASVQQLLYAAIRQYKGYAEFHDETVRTMLSDAWEELRMRPTALSPQDLEQLSAEIDRMLARRAFTEDLARRYERMLLNPFFARFDFREKGEKELEKIVIGLYGLKNEKGEILVHDWRAPICSLYYDSIPGPVSYLSPSGTIEGVMTRKRQYRMEDGRLKYFVDTDVSIDDEVLLDILSRATSRHMRSIVTTIQKEQNAAIRRDDARVLSVVGAAGSGKTSVAMHRAAYLMYHQRNSLDARRIAVLSPGSAFSEYVSTVLPDLGEENAQSVTLRGILKELIGQDCESPVKQVERLIQSDDDTLRRQSVRYKSDMSFCAALDRFAERFRNYGPNFETLSLGKHTLASQAELEKFYRVEFRHLNPALRLIRIQTVLGNRLENWEKTLKTQYETRLFKDYRGKDLELATHIAVSKHLQPVRMRIKQMLEMDPLDLYARAISSAPANLAQAARENAAARLIWWEDAPGIAYLLLKSGFTAPNKQIRQLLIDEAQDYSCVALKMLRLYYPEAHVTLLGDSNQRTCPGMVPCDPELWGRCFDQADAPLIRLQKCYRSTLEITRLCNALLPSDEKPQIFGREGDWPMIAPFEEKRLMDTIEAWREKGLRSIAVITRTQADANRYAALIKGSTLLNGDDEDMLPDAGGVVVAGYHLVKGLEFDAAVVVWPRARLTDGEHRRLYTACSRALHGLCLLTDPMTIKELGIVL